MNARESGPQTPISHLASTDRGSVYFTLFPLKFTISRDYEYIVNNDHAAFLNAIYSLDDLLINLPTPRDVYRRIAVEGKGKGKELRDIFKRTIYVCLRARRIHDHEITTGGLFLLACSIVHVCSTRLHVRKRDLAFIKD